MASDPYTIFCYVIGLSADAFSFKMAKSSTIDDLKKQIKEEIKNTLKNFDAPKLSLWKVSDLDNDEDTLTRNAKSLCDDMKVKEKEKREARQRSDDGKLNTGWLLSQCWPTNPPPEKVHVLVELPDKAATGTTTTPEIDMDSLPELETARLKQLDHYPKKSPSDLAQISNLNNNWSIKVVRYARPLSNAPIIPVTLLHPIFNEFIDDCENLTKRLSRSDNQFALHLSKAMSGWFNAESSRKYEFLDICRKYGLHLAATKIQNTEYTTDADIRVRGYLTTLGELKLEMGAKGAEPIVQACCYYTSAMRYSRDILKIKSPFPCIGFYLSGAGIGFIGFALTDVTNVQVLGPTLRLDCDPRDLISRRRNSRYLAAFRQAVQRLENYYQRLPGVHTLADPHPGLDSAADPRWPCYNMYKSLLNGSTRYIKYVAHPMKEKLIFFGVTDGVEVCIKFTQQYSRECHNRCFQLGIAPKLHGFEILPGNWFMVVMDRIDKDYLALDDARQRGTTDLGINLKDLMAHRLGQLHQSELVHGDVRDANVMVRKNGELGFMLVDFDWGGKIGEIRYPMDVNTETIRRPEGAIDDGLIEAKHDMVMLDYLFS